MTIYVLRAQLRAHDLKSAGHYLNESGALRW